MIEGRCFTGAPQPNNHVWDTRTECHRRCVLELRRRRIWSPLHDPQYWCSRAAEMRALSEMVTDPEECRIMTSPRVMSASRKWPRRRRRSLAGAGE